MPNWWIPGAVFGLLTLGTSVHDALPDADDLWLTCLSIENDSGCLPQPDQSLLRTCGLRCARCLQTRTSALGIKLEEDPSGTVLSEPNLSQLAQSVHGNALRAAGSAQCPPMSVSVACARGSLQLIPTGLSLQSDGQPDQRPELLTTLLDAARSKQQSSSGDDQGAAPLPHEALPPPAPPPASHPRERLIPRPAPLPPSPPPPAPPAPLPAPAFPPASSPPPGILPGSDCPAGASRADVERLTDASRSADAGRQAAVAHLDSGSASGSGRARQASGAPLLAARSRQPPEATYPAVLEPRQREPAPEAQRQRSKLLLASESGTQFASAAKDDIATLLEMLLPQPIT